MVFQHLTTNPWSDRQRLQCQTPCGIRVVQRLEGKSLQPYPQELQHIFQCEAHLQIGVKNLMSVLTFLSWNALMEPYLTLAWITYQSVSPMTDLRLPPLVNCNTNWNLFYEYVSQHSEHNRPITDSTSLDESVWHFTHVLQTVTELRTPSLRYSWTVVQRANTTGRECDNLAHIENFINSAT